jgi:hypothetical protein
MLNDIENSEINREKEQIKLLKKGIDEINQHNPSVDEMQKDTENNNPSTEGNSNQKQLTR